MLVFLLEALRVDQEARFSSIVTDMENCWCWRESLQVGLDRACSGFDDLEFDISRLGFSSKLPL